MGKVLNEISIRSKIINASKQKQYAGLASSAANTRLVFAKQSFFRNFDNNEITRELLQDPTVDGSSLVSHGNLVSFLGLPNGESDIAQLKLFLDENISMENKPKISTDKNRIYYEFPVNIPTNKEIHESFPTPDNWSSRSWIDIIERGIGNAAYYIFRAAGLPNSRSGTGLQRTDRAPRKKGGSFSPKKWISELLNDFRKKFQ